MAKNSWTEITFDEDVSDRGDSNSSSTQQLKSTTDNLNKNEPILYLPENPAIYTAMIYIGN